MRPRDHVGPGTASNLPCRRREAVGVDGCRSGWAVAAVCAGRIDWSVCATFATVLDTYPDAIVAVDMPIGLADGPRPCDLAARDFLRVRGAPWQSIFLTPTRATADAWARSLTHAEAMRGRGPASGTSIQAWNLLGKIVELEHALDGRTSVVEAHPECSFRVLDPSIGAASKKTARGAGLRLRALGREFELPDLCDAPAGAPVDDLLDATVLAWTARRYAAAAAIVLPDGATAAPRIVV